MYIRTHTANCCHWWLTRFRLPTASGWWKHHSSALRRSAQAPLGKAKCFAGRLGLCSCCIGPSKKQSPNESNTKSMSKNTKLVLMFATGMGPYHFWSSRIIHHQTMIHIKQNRMSVIGQYHCWHALGRTWNKPPSSIPGPKLAGFPWRFDHLKMVCLANYGTSSIHHNEWGFHGRLVPG